MPYRRSGTASSRSERARSQLRLAVATETWPPEVNGVAMSLARLVDGLRSRGHEIDLVRPRQGPAAPDIGRAIDGSATAVVGPGGPETDGEVIVPALPIPRHPGLRMGVPSARRLAARWRGRPPDLVHIATEGPLGWSALRAARALRLPVSSEFRTNFHEYGRHYGIGWMRRPILAYLRWFHNAADCTMVPTQRLRASLAQAGFGNVETVSRGVDARLFSPARRSRELRRQWGADDGDCVMITVGRIAPEKNAGLLLRAFEAMRAIRPRTRLVFVGDGPARRELSRLCPEALFVGARYGEDLAAHYASADIFGFASLTDTFGNVTLEAMASGLAVLAYDDAAAGELIENGVDGLLAPVRDEARFVRLGCELVMRPERIAAMGRRARDRAMRRDWDRVVEQVESRMVGLVEDHEAARAGAALGPYAC